MSCHHEHFRNHHRNGLARIVSLVVGGIVIAGFFSLAFGWLVMLLWNWLMPSIFSLKPITYWQAFGLTILAKLVLSGIHDGGHTFGNHMRDHRHGGFSPSGWMRPDDRSPGGDRRNWLYYREYWNERGREDFEQYLKNRKPGMEEGGEGRE
jgi:hypothetical protein